jgi:hypothetical protein
MIRVLVCGSRTFTDRDKLFNTLYDFVEERGLKSEPDNYGNWLPHGLTIIHGGAKGADLFADEWAVVNWVPFEEYKADWDTHGRAAGHIRNQQMLDTGVDVVIAFPEGEARGTRHMMKIARAKGVEVIEVE